MESFGSDHLPKLHLFSDFNALCTESLFSDVRPFPLQSLGAFPFMSPNIQSHHTIHSWLKSENSTNLGKPYCLPQGSKATFFLNILNGAATKGPEYTWQFFGLLIFRKKRKKIRSFSKNSKNFEKRFL